jgi:flagellar biosynthesis GTPase FlhF
MIARRLSLHSAATSTGAPGPPLDTGAAATITRDLTAHGLSGAMASALIAEAAAHGSALAAEHNLRAGARAQLVRRLGQPPPLPVTGAAVAFVGAGGAGKTSCAAALASAYASASTLTVSALSLNAPDGGRALTELLRGTRIEIHAVGTQHAARAVAARRAGGLVILDTVAISPGDGAAMRALGAELEPLALDAIYLALPATLGAHAARGVLASFTALHPTAVAITHADETDQIGVAVEIAAANRIPLVYVHAGTDPRTAISALDTHAIVAQLLP